MIRSIFFILLLCGLCEAKSVKPPLCPFYVIDFDSSVTFAPHKLYFINPSKPDSLSLLSNDPARMKLDTSYRAPDCTKFFIFENTNTTNKSLSVFQVNHLGAEKKWSSLDHLPPKDSPSFFIDPFYSLDSKYLYFTDLFNQTSSTYNFDFYQLDLSTYSLKKMESGPYKKSDILKFDPFKELLISYIEESTQFKIKTLNTRTGDKKTSTITKSKEETLQAHLLQVSEDFIAIPFSKNTNLEDKLSDFVIRFYQISKNKILEYNFKQINIQSILDSSKDVFAFNYSYPSPENLNCIITQITLLSPLTEQQVSYKDTNCAGDYKGLSHRFFTSHKDHDFFVWRLGSIDHELVIYQDLKNIFTQSPKVIPLEGYYNLVETASGPLLKSFVGPQVFTLNLSTNILTKTPVESPMQNMEYRHYWSGDHNYFYMAYDDIFYPDAAPSIVGFGNVSEKQARKLYTLPKKNYTSRFIHTSDTHAFFIEVEREKACYIKSLNSQGLLKNVYTFETPGSSCMAYF